MSSENTVSSTNISKYTIASKNQSIRAMYKNISIIISINIRIQLVLPIHKMYYQFQKSMNQSCVLRNTVGSNNTLKCTIGSKNQCIKVVYQAVFLASLLGSFLKTPPTLSCAQALEVIMIKDDKDGAVIGFEFSAKS